eukprot:scaffold214540_cov18-Prasinocladus_malaysianus.AAC.1
MAFAQADDVVWFIKLTPLASAGKLQPYARPPAWVESTTSMPQVVQAPSVAESFFQSQAPIVGGEPGGAGTMHIASRIVHCPARGVG